MDCTMRVAKTKVLISCAELICVFVFAYAKKRFSQNEAHITSLIEIRKSVLHLIIHLFQRIFNVK